MMEKVANKTDKILLDDKKISIALMASFVILTIQYFVLIFFAFIGTPIGAAIQLLSKGLVGSTFVYALVPVLKRNRIRFIAVYFIAIFIFLLHYIIFPENKTYMLELFFPIFFMSLPSFIYGLSIQEFSVLKEIMKKSSYIILVLGVLLGGLIFTGKASVGAYSMSLSYYMLLPSIIFFDELLDEFSLKSLIFFVLSLIVILALGSRGTILCIIVFMGLKLLRPQTKGIHKKIVMNSGIFSAGLFIFVYL